MGARQVVDFRHLSTVLYSVRNSRSDQYVRDGFTRRRASAGFGACVRDGDIGLDRVVAVKFLQKLIRPIL